MNNNQVEKGKNLTSALISTFGSLDKTPMKSEVEMMAKVLNQTVGYDGSLDSIVEEVLIAIDTRMGAGVSLIDTKAVHDDEWVYKREIGWVYSEGYEEYLKSEKWNPTVVQSLSDVSAKILGHLQDPFSEGSWDRRGLVIGHVQSGKTANYIGLVSRSADAGYKFIIVIAGIHNNLRKQTQERVDEGFVGRSSDPEDRKTIGVGFTDKEYPHPATLTNIYNDFNKQTANRSGWSINDFSKPIILVIKKNVSTLTSLQRWLKELNTRGDGKISDVPMLMIDDEADNASINTNKEDLDPTKTNLRIREILGMFEKSCYVGYTATPFANIFINPEAYDDEVYNDLFPKDFIYCLDAPTTYFGPEKVFLEDDSSDLILTPIRDAEDYLPFSHKKDYEIPDLPPSLYRAVDQFILARTIRNLRGHENKHCSMMINVSRFVDIQKTVRDFVSAYVKKLKEAIKVNYAMPDSVSARNQYMSSLEREFNAQFSSSEYSWNNIKVELLQTFKNLRIFLVNSKSDEALDYKKYEKDNVGLTAIAIGGLSLSRGLTIEGLTVSYMYRNTRMYDTLMQMGRWFGYRPGYEDLCRVYLSDDSINWYAHISEAAEELRQQIKQMRKDRLSPEDFGLYVKAHPDRLLVTAANKMRSGEKVTVKQNFSNKIRETFILPVDEKVNEINRQLIEKYWKKGFGNGKDAVLPTGKGWFIENVQTEIIDEFLLSFRTHSLYVNERNSQSKYLESIQEKYPNSDVLLISIKEKEKSEYMLGSQDRERGVKKSTDRWQTSKGRVASRGDEKLGLLEDQLKKAQVDAGDKKPSDNHYRKVRNKPLLMLHYLDLKSESEEQNNVPAYGISFPPGDYSEGIDVVVNQVWIDQVYGETFDIPDEEEDYDE